jgi:E3 ubiquitin-protein ligase synoviolin
LLLVLVGQALKRIFLGSLSRDEVEELISSSKYAITETCLALTIFREELSMRVLMLFSALLFVKIFHWLASLRVEGVARLGQMPTRDHIRLLSLLAFLATIDSLFTITISIHLLATRQASVLLLFGFEYAILLVSVITTFFKYIVFIIDLRMDGRWQSKSSVLFYLEFTGDLLRLGLYLVFFMIICAYYGLPLHLIRELCVTFYHLRDRIIKFITYRRMTKNMNERFIDATPEELANQDITCIVCREDMTEAKKLPW